MHQVWVPWSPLQRLPEEIVKLLMVILGMEKMKATFTKEQEASKVIGPGRSPEDSSPPLGRKGNSSERMDKKGTKRRRTTGDDPPDEEDPPDGIHCDGDFVDFKGYLEVRVFTFLHHFSGREDRLSKAIEEEAARRGVRVNTVSVDLELNGQDLTAPTPYNNHLYEARQGAIDSYHSGFPCNTYTILRWRPSPSMPGPLRSKEFPYGFDDLDEKKRTEVDKGTVMMARSVEMCKAMRAADADQRVPGFFTLENPPPTDHHSHVSAWHMDELVDLVETTEAWCSAFFNTCSYEDDVPLGERHYKPQLVGGTLPGILSLSRRCQCQGKPHEPIIGKDKSAKAAAYPWAFCRAYAVLAVNHYIKMATVEFYEGRSVLLEGSIRLKKEKAESHDVRRKESEDKTAFYERKIAKYQRIYEEKKDNEEARKGLEWKGGDGKYGLLKEPKKKEDLPRALAYVGGMRMPHKSIAKFPTVQTLGYKMRDLWKTFIYKYPEALEVAEQYGTEECKFNEEVVKAWKNCLTSLWGEGEPEEVILKANTDYVSPVDTKMLEAWRKKSGDPESHVVTWLRKGCPLGIEEEIGVSGIFPPNENEEVITEGDGEADALLERGDLRNYISFEEAREDAEIEIDRYQKEGYLVRISRQEAMHRFKNGAISKMALVVKTKETGEVKRRVVIDLRRSGGNSKSRLPEKLVLPRVVDAIRTLREVRRAEGRERDSSWNLEFSLVDIADAFTVMPVAEKELKHTLAPSTNPEEILVFQALLFGYKVAPLIYARFASMLVRLLQSGLEVGEGAHNVYLDDSLWIFQGSLKERSASLSFVLNTMKALGVKVALKKGQRAAEVQWVGVTFTLVDPDTLILNLPAKFMEELKMILVKWEGAGQAPVKELRMVAGKCAWLGGVLPRARWITSVMYAVLTQTLRDELSGAEEQRRGRRSDQRSKRGLFVVKRLELARAWLVKFIDKALERPMRKIYLGTKSPVDIRLLTDASPEALGAVLLVNGRILGALSSEVTEQDAKSLKFEQGTSASQATLEVLAVLVGLRFWGSKLSGSRVHLAVQSDSVVALALTQRLSNSSPSINFLGSELAYTLEALNVEEIHPVHIPGKANEECDYLSRPSTWKQHGLPKALEGFSIQKPPPRDEGFYVLPGPSTAPELWGSKDAATSGVWEAVV